MAHLFGDPPKTSQPSTSSGLEGYVRAFKLTDFMDSSEARLIRIQCELLEPEVRLRKEKVYSTIVFFGSARTPTPEDAAAALKAVEAKPGATQQELRIARNVVSLSRYYTQAEELAARLTTWSMQFKDPKQQHVICSGGGPGFMEAANRGAQRAGGRSIGLNIKIPSEQHPNPYIPEELSFKFQYFFIRKFWFLRLVQAIVVFPGGWGTFDELFEVLTLLKTGRMHISVPIILYGSDYWKDLVNFQRMVDFGTLPPDYEKLIHFSDSIEDSFELITSRLEARNKA